MGLDSTGIFAIATYMAVMVSVPFRSVTAIASPQLARAIKEQNREEGSKLIQQVTRNLLLIGGFILLLIWINIDLIFYILPNGYFCSGEERSAHLGCQSIGFGYILYLSYDA